MIVKVARIVEKSEDTDQPTGWQRENIADNAASDIASRLYRAALIEGRDVYYVVELYDVQIKSTAGAVLRFANSLEYL